MDALTLLGRARAARLQVRAAGDELVVRGPRSQAGLVRELFEHKAEVLAALRVAEPRDHLDPFTAAVVDRFGGQVLAEGEGPRPEDVAPVDLRALDPWLRPPERRRR